MTCDGADAPHFDPLNPPTTCGTGAVAVPLITVFDRDLKYPQNWKFALGLDQRLPWGLVATVDLLYTYWVNQFYFTDANLTPPIGTAAGEGGRLLYGTTPRRNGTPSRSIRRSARSSGSRITAATSLPRVGATPKRVRQRLGPERELHLLARGRRLLPHRLHSGDNLRDTPLDGSLADRADQPPRSSACRTGYHHRVRRPSLRSRFSLIYQGSSPGTLHLYRQSGSATTAETSMPTASTSADPSSE